MLRHRALVLALAAAAGLAVTLLALDRSQLPFLWIWAYWLVFLHSAAWALRGAARAAALSAGALLLVLLGLEADSAGLLRGPALYSGDWLAKGRYFRRDADLGYAAIPGAAVRSRKMSGGRLLYDVRYAIDRYGLRETPHVPRAADALLFFGDSLTFGEGVEDWEAYPARVQALLSPRFKSLNLAFHGYGPQQMLRILEKRGERPALEGRRPRHAFYLALPDHADRAAGGLLWSPSAPRYELDASGRPLHAGPLYPGAWGRLRRQAAKSSLFRREYGRFRLGAPSREGSPELERMAAIVAASGKIIDERYGARLHVLAWGDAGPLCARLAREDVECVALSEVLPGFDRDRLLIPGDGHFNALAHRLIAEYAAERIRSGAADR